MCDEDSGVVVAAVVAVVVVVIVVLVDVVVAAVPGSSRSRLVVIKACYVPASRPGLIFCSKRLNYKGRTSIDRR